jgi:hypothetical protein
MILLAVTADANIVVGVQNTDLDVPEIVVYSTR